MPHRCREISEQTVKKKKGEGTGGGGEWAHVREKADWALGRELHRGNKCAILMVSKRPQTTDGDESYNSGSDRAASYEKYWCSRMMKTQD